MSSGSTLSKMLLKALLERRGGEPARPQHALVDALGWRSAYFGGLKLDAEEALAKASPRVLDILAQLDDADLYPGALDLMVATAVPHLAHRMHAFYAGEGLAIHQTFTPDELAALDELVVLEVEALTDLDEASWSWSNGGSSVQVDRTVRALLKRAGYRVKPVLRQRLPEPAVAANPLAVVEPFEILEDGALRDRRSGLVWKAFPAGERLTWDEAMDPGAAGERWRLPTRSELGTLTGTEGLPEVWVWTAESSSFLEYAWCGRVDGAAREVLRSWRLSCWKVRAVARLTEVSAA